MSAARPLFPKNSLRAWAVLALLLFALTIPLPGTRIIQDSAHYLPLHTLLESFAVFVALMVFVQVLAAGDERSRSDAVLGAGFLAVALIGFAHMLSYYGMPVFVTPADQNKAINFWLAARLIAAITLIAAALESIHRRKAASISQLVAVALAVCGLVYWIGLWHADWLPRTFIPGQGLTPFKIAVEVVVIGLNLLAAALLLRWYRRSGFEYVGFLASAAWVSALGELFFTVYANVTDLYNLLGHLFNAGAYLLILRATMLQLVEIPIKTATARWQFALEGGGQGVWDADLASGQVFYSPQWKSMLGFAADELDDSFATWRDRIHPDDRTGVEAAIGKYSRGESASYETRHRMRTKDGDWIWILSRGMAVERAADGTVARMIGTHTDITDLMRNEETLRESERRLRSTLDTLHFATQVGNIGIWIWDVRANSQNWDSGMFDIYGIPPEQRGASLDYAFWASRVHPDDLPLAEGKLRDQIDGTGTYNPVFRVLRPDGSLRWVEAAAFIERDASGEATRMIGVNHDVTSLKDAEARLIELNAGLEARVAERTAELTMLNERLSSTERAMGEMGIGVAWNDIDSGGRFLYVNDEACRQLGYAREELLQLTVADINPAYPAAAVRDLAPRLRSAGGIATVESVHRRKDGSTYPAEVSLYLQQNRENEWFIALFRNISERKLAEAEREAARAAAENLARMKSEFLANMSHEIRTPLNGVLGLAHIGFRDSEGRGSAQETFARILDSGRLLLTVINDILDFSKIEAGKLDIESLPFDPGRLADEAAGLMRTKAAEQGLPLLVEKAADLPRACLGDPVRITQVLLNLLSNALKFTAAGSVRCSVGREGEELVYRVSDSGIGIAAGAIERLFQPFEQADGSTTRRFGGTGLGLAISRRLAELMGGRIEAESEPGRGSTFSLRLPLRATDLPLPAPAQQGGGQRLAGLVLLAAEDNTVNQMILEDCLAREGALVTLAGDGLAALEAVARAPEAYDAVLMDVQMPVMDGLEATRRLRSSHPALPVIGQTAHALKEEYERCMGAGMVAVVTKPIDVDTLVATILAHARGPQPARMSAARAAPLAPAGSDLPAVDWAALDKRYGGRQDFVERLVRIALDNHAGEAQHLRTLVELGDVGALARIAHDLKGIGGNLCATELSRQATATMKAARTGAPETPALALSLADALDRLLAALHEGKPN